MQKLDAIVAAVGALILMIAIGGAALNGGGFSRTSFDVTFPTHDHVVALSPKSPIPTHDTTTFVLNESNVVKANVSVTFTSTAPFPPGTSAHLKVTAPDGETRETDGAATAVASFTLKEDITFGAPPEHARYSASDAPAAERAAWDRNLTKGTGNWSVEVSFAGGAAALPTPLPGGSMQVAYGWTSWVPQAHVAVPTAR